MTAFTGLALGSTMLTGYALGSTIVDFIRDLFKELSGTIATGTGRLSIGPIAGTDPAGMGFLGYFTAPVGGFEPDTILWYTTSGTHEAYLSITSVGELYVSIYTRVNGELRPEQTIYFQGDPIQPGERFALIGRGIADGAFAIYQYRENAGAFVNGGSVVIPAGAAFPLYGQEYTFFGSPIASEGLFIFEFEDLPEVLFNTGTINAALASFVNEDGSRPSIDTIRATLGVPIFAIYGPAETITVNRGTAGGIFAETGRITDYAPAPFVPSLVRSENKYLTTSLPAGIDEGRPALAMVVSYSHLDSSITSGDQVFRMAGSINNGFRPLNDSRQQAGVKYWDAAGAEQFATVQSSNTLATRHTPQPLLALAAPGNGLDFYRYDRAAEALIKVGSAAIPSDAEIRLDGISAQIFTNLQNFRINSLAVYKLAALPSDVVGNVDKIFDVNGLGVRPSITDAYFGDEAIIRMAGDAESWATGADTGAAGVTWNVIDGTQSSPFAALDPATDWPGYVAPVVEEPDENPLAATAYIEASRDYALPFQPTAYVVRGLTTHQLATYGFKWEFGGGGTPDWTLYQGEGMPAQIATGRHKPRGHRTGYLWDDSGSKSVSCWVIPPSWDADPTPFKLEMSFPVSSYAETFPTVNDVWHVSPNGNYSAFAGAPAGQQTTSFKTAWDAAKSRKKGLIYLDPGQNYPDPSSLSFDDALNSVIQVRNVGDPRSTKVEIYTGELSIGCNNDNVGVTCFVGVRFKGGYDSINLSGAPRKVVFSPRSNQDLTCSYCENIGNQKLYAIRTPDGTSIEGQFLFYECLAEEWEDYPWGHCEETRLIALLGCRNLQNPMTKNGAEAKELGRADSDPDHGSARAEAIRSFISWNTWSFQRAGWSPGNYYYLPEVGSVYKALQPVYRLGSREMAQDETDSVYLGQTYVEGGGTDVGAGNAIGSAGAANLVVVDSAYFLSTAESVNGAFSSGHTNIYAGNTIYVVPDTRPATPKNFTAWNMDNAKQGGSQPAQPDWFGGMDHASHFSIAYMRSASNDDNPMSLGALTGETFMEERRVAYGVEYESGNHLVWAPSIATPVIPSGGITAQPFGPEPLYNGLRQEMTDGSILELPEFASPPGSAAIPVPVGNPTAEPVSWGFALDFHGNRRPLTPTQGAIEKAPLADPT